MPAPVTLHSLRSQARPPARAGQFYPADPRQIEDAIDKFLALDAGAAKAPCKALMLPHAGWVYCGATIGKTLARVSLADTMIIISPRHTPYGANWSIAPHGAWAYPGGVTVPIDTALVDRLTQLMPYMQAEPQAHLMEHGVEVLLPFLRRLNPNLRVVPIVLGRASFGETSQLAEMIAIAVRERAAKGQEVALVISSDMNHFANEDENRRLDGMALDCMLKADAASLYETCTRNNISMCGMIPAVTIMQTLQHLGIALKPTLVDYRTSAQASGDRSRVVGYAGVTLA